MNFPDSLVNGQSSFSGRLKQAVLVCLRLFLFCVVSLAAVSVAAWCLFCIIDPDHSITSAIQRTLGFIRIPFGVTAGLCIFFAAVSWNSPISSHGALANKDLSGSHIAIHRRTSAGRREVS